MTSSVLRFFTVVNMHCNTCLYDEEEGASVQRWRKNMTAWRALIRLKVTGWDL